jgi:hypothetical protein
MVICFPIRADAYNPQAGDEEKELKGMPALSFMVKTLRDKQAKGEKITLKDLHGVMPFKAIMAEEDRKQVGSIAKDCISELGRVAGEGCPTASSSSTGDNKPAKKAASVLSFFG